MERADFIVVGAGIAGASAAWGLSTLGRVILIERESQPGYHTTGRSAALFTEGYGNSAIRALTRASRPLFDDPPPEFGDAPLLTPRGVMMFARADQRDLFEAELATLAAASPTARRLTAAEMTTLCPVLDHDRNPLAFHEPDAADMNVHAIHHGFLRGFRARGGALLLDAEVVGIAAGWRVGLRDGRQVEAPILVDAAGAWADEIARLAGVRPIGLLPKRRTAILFDPPFDCDSHGWPLVIDIAETLYFKPDAGKLLASPADETPSEPTDAQPEEFDIAVLIDRLERETRLVVGRPSHRWAGLRSFVADKTIVAGFAPDAPGFFWCAGQGGYGIQTAGAMAAVVPALVRDGRLPDHVAREGVTVRDLAADRPGLGV
jgi:D-arginine dehydrogenase